MERPLTDLLNKRGELYRFTRARRVSWEEIEEMCKAFAPRVAPHHELIVGILRFGAPIATLLSRHTNLPLDFLLVSGAFNEPVFPAEEARIPRGKRILLVDDTCGTGFTLKSAAAFFARYGNTTSTFSCFYSPGRYVPDFGTPIDEDVYLEWPWQYGDDPVAPTG